MSPKKPRRELSPHTRTLIVTARAEGRKPREIAEALSVSQGTIYGVVARYGARQSAQSGRRTGRPPTLTERDKRRVLRIVARDPFVSVRELRERAGLACSEKTISRILKEEGVRVASV